MDKYFAHRKQIEGNKWKTHIWEAFDWNRRANHKSYFILLKIWSICFYIQDSAHFFDLFRWFFVAVPIHTEFSDWRTSERKVEEEEVKRSKCIQNNRCIHVLLCVRGIYHCSLLDNYSHAAIHALSHLTIPIAHMSTDAATFFSDGFPCLCRRTGWNSRDWISKVGFS